MSDSVLQAGDTEWITVRVAGGSNNFNNNNGDNTEVCIAFLHLDYVDAYLISFYIKMKKDEKHGDSYLIS